MCWLGGSAAILYVGVVVGFADGTGALGCMAVVVGIASLIGLVRYGILLGTLIEQFKNAARLAEGMRQRVRRHDAA